MRVTVELLRVQGRPEVMAEIKRTSFVALGSAGEFEQNWVIWKVFLKCSKVISPTNTEEK